LTDEDEWSITVKYRAALVGPRNSMSAGRDSTVFVGKKPVMNYVLACLTLFQNGTEEVSLKARGRAISTAVDTAQILTNKFVPDASVKEVAIDTEQVTSLDSGEVSNVSSIEIRLSRGSVSPSKEG
jgi:DNA-binding protein